MADFIKKLQEKPYEVKVRILWGTVIGAAIILVVILVFNIKSTLQNVDGKKLIDLNTPSSQTTKDTEIQYASVERVERTEKVLKIYFNLNNSTDDILNVSKVSDITLTFDGNESKPQSMADRQGSPFVQKILSHTQNFGVLTFAPINANLATLTLDQMYLEKNPSSIFQQKLELDLDKLTETTKVRN